MAVTYSKAGRSCYVAELDQGQDKELTLRYEFHNACRTLHYGEMMALSRNLAVSYWTVLKWKYNMRFPRRDVAQQVIDWVRAGKPMKQVRPYPESFNIL